ncbi:MAG TPA: hypothetical protein VF551_08770 [Chthoniobacterales bacterium]
MKILLAALMCLVFCTVQCYAVKGGPIYPAGTNVTGTYAGVLEPRFDPTDPFSTNSLGIFSLSVPATGLAGGSFVMFVRGTVFKGTIQGLGNPNNGTVTGVLDASFSVLTNQFVINDPFFGTFTSSSSTVTARAQGNLNARVSTARGALTTSATLLTGTANLFVSEAPSASPTPSPTAGASPTPTPASGGGSGTGSVTAAFTLDVAGFKQSSTAVPVTVTGTPGS